MAWLAVDEDLEEYIFDVKPERCVGEINYWDITEEDDQDDFNCVELPFGTIEKLIGKVLTWADEPVEIY